MNDVIYIGSDDSGYDLKLKAIEYLQNNGFEYKDCGSSTLPARYPYYAAQVASAVSTGKAKRGILICGSGIGISIAANKFKGVRASVCTDVLAARLTRSHNDSNILCMGGHLIGDWQAINILKIWLNTEYDGGHHEGSLALISEMEEYMFNGKIWAPDPPESNFTWNLNQRI